MQNETRLEILEPIKIKISLNAWFNFLVSDVVSFTIIGLKDIG